MTTDAKGNTMTTDAIGTNIPVEQLKEILKSSNNDSLERFMHGYALGLGADLFIGVMLEPGQRADFLVAIAKTYPDDWKKALELLAKV